MFKTYFLNSQKLPLVVQPRQKQGSLAILNELALSNRDFFRAKLLEHGALLFRGFQVQDPKEFRDFVREFSGREFFNYAGGASPRTSLEKNIYNSTEYAPNLTLELHNELSYSKVYPRHLYFFCQTAPEKGGETALGDSRRILRKIRPKIVGLFKHKNVLYERHLRNEKGNGFSWQEAFENDERQKVEEICRQTGVEYEWQEDNCLRLRQIRPATCIHPETQDEVWFNQAHGFHTSALDDETLAAYRVNGEKPRLISSFGDDSPICSLIIEHIRGILRQETIPHRWRAGDILILDNILTAHGRMPFSGARKIVLAMS
jgi:alpha-ketoglutarate-dependent taurine dioxygenase